MEIPREIVPEPNQDETQGQILERRLALATQFYQHGNPGYGFCAAQLRNNKALSGYEAEDVLQELLESITRNTDNLLSPKEDKNLRAYLFRAVRNKIIDIARREKTREGHNKKILARSAEGDKRPLMVRSRESSYKEKGREVIKLILGKMDPFDADLLKKVYFENQSLPSLEGKVLGRRSGEMLTQGGLKTALYNARQQFKDRYERLRRTKPDEIPNFELLNLD